MNVKLLIDAIVQQTTLLIGQLSTAAGIRAPLSHVADRVFLELAKELETQGVARRVAADMFGMALRSYQKKLRRLTASATHADRTLWQAILEFVDEGSQVTKRDVVVRFRADGEREVGAVLSDLVRSGLVYQTGQGATAVYGVTSAADRQRLVSDDEVESVVPLVWAAVQDSPGVSVTELVERLGVSRGTIHEAVEELVQEGTLLRDGVRLRAVELVVPVGAERGWELATIDHFRAVVNAIAAKVRLGGVRSEVGDTVGGATLSFDLSPGHPYAERVTNLLSEVRAVVNQLWDDVEAYNAEHPIADEERQRVFFYFGQYVEEVE